MIKNIGTVYIVCILFSVLVFPYSAYSQQWPVTKIQSLPDSSFALSEVTKDGIKLRHCVYRDIYGHIDINQVIYCLGTLSNETWVNPENIETARKCLEEHYYRFKLNQTKEGIATAININAASLKDLIRLPNIGSVTGVKIFKFRETDELFKNIEDIQKVEGIGPAIFAGIKYYIKVR
jgi:competence ComEA-like helix-hairpin-helix protein